MKKRNTSVKVPKVITVVAQILEKISPNLALKFGLLFFYKPTKFVRPKREEEIYDKANKEYITVNGKKIRVYKWQGGGNKKILLVHGWSGRGTQMNKIIEAMLTKNNAVYSFDALAHGESEGRQTHMYEFVDCIIEMDKAFGGFDMIIGHSMGGIATLNAVYKGVQVPKVSIIGTPNLLENVISDFCMNLNFGDKMISVIKEHLENRYGGSIYSISAEVIGNKIDIPILIIHDENDIDVLYTEAETMHNKIQKSTLLTTQKLGHRKILADNSVITKIIEFL